MTEQTPSLDLGSSVGGSQTTVAPETMEDVDLVLTPPQAVAPVAPTRASRTVPLDDQKATALAQRAEAYAASLTSMAVGSPELAKKVDEISVMGDEQVRATSAVSNRMLSRPVTALAQAKGQKDGGQEKVAKTLVELRRMCEDLDPSQVNATGLRKLINSLPFGDQLKDYFAKYQSAQKNIDKILSSLISGQRELTADNEAIEKEKGVLWASMQQLQEYITLAEALDAAVTAKIAAIEATDPQRATGLKSDVLFAVRQKHQDLLTQMAVAAQGYLALDMVRKNNIELIKGVKRATTTTISALRTAVIVAQALANQKLVLDQVTALNTTTSNIIQATSEMLASQSAEIQKQAASSTVSMEALSTAFRNVYATMDSIDQFKSQAADNIAVTVRALESELATANSYLERAHKDTAEV